MAYKNNYHGSIKAIWGLAKSPELSLDDENLYALIERETKKDSMRKLSQSEIDHVCRILQNMKEEQTRKSRRKRTDTGGVEATKDLRKKIYILTGRLGWNNNNNRINGFVRKNFGIDRIEWLSVTQCMKLIEILKKMVKREEGKDGLQENPSGEKIKKIVELYNLGYSMDRIVRELGIAKETLVRHLDMFERCGLVNRTDMPAKKMEPSLIEEWDRVWEAAQLLKEGKAKICYRNGKWITVLK